MLEQGAIFLPKRQKDSPISYEAGLAPSRSPAALWTGGFAVVGAAAKKQPDSFRGGSCPSRSPAALWTGGFAIVGAAAKKQPDSLRGGPCPSCSPAIVPTCAMPKTPHPPNQVRHLLLEEMALLPRPSCLHNSCLHNLRYVMANKHRIRHYAQHRAIFSQRSRLCYLVQIVYIIQLT